jgi:thiol-disulfide isomerase/thioredoxin
MRLLVALGLLWAGAVHAADQDTRGHSGAHMVPPSAPASPEAMIPSLSGATAWLNSRPLTAEDLRGKVVAVDFWTYTCINWRRTQPYLRAWHERYGKSGLLMIGVHSPEFTFEQNLENVRQFAKPFGVDYPVAVDTDFSIWRAFGNEYWPALYIFDARGRLRHTQFGEGGYEKTDQILRELLAEAGHPDPSPKPTAVDPRGFEKQADWNALESPESYLGQRQTLTFLPKGGMVPGKAHAYSLPPAIALNRWALGGTWNVAADRVIAPAAGGKLAFRFRARDLHLVMAPETRGVAIKFRVLLDGKPPGDSHGLDVDEKGQGTLRDQRMYQLIRQPGQIEDRLFEIEFLEPGAAAYCFTFG